MSLKELQNRIGYRFRDEELLMRAVTHSSYAFETGERNHHLLSNERLEFLGDAVLSILSGRFLYSRYPMLSEGELSRMRSDLVCENTLSEFANRIGLGEFLLFGRGEAQNGGAHKPAILADAFEALVAAIYLDTEDRGLDSVAAFVIPFLEGTIGKMTVGEADSKTLLQVFLQKDGTVLPKYKVVAESGPDHAKVFSVEVYLDSNRIGCGVGTSKRQAEQEAAADALRLFGVTR